VSRRRVLAAVLAAALTALPSLALACAACGVGNGRNKMAFFLTTLFLSLLPLGLIGAGLLWIVRNSRAFIASEFRESDETGAEGASPGSGPARS
jgi:hypothetical protein